MCCVSVCWPCALATGDRASTSASTSDCQAASMIQWPCNSLEESPSAELQRGAGVVFTRGRWRSPPCVLLLLTAGRAPCAACQLLRCEGAEPPEPPRPTRPRAHLPGCPSTRNLPASQSLTSKRPAKMSQVVFVWPGPPGKRAVGPLPTARCCVRVLVARGCRLVARARRHTAWLARRQPVRATCHAAAPCAPTSTCMPRCLRTPAARPCTCPMRALQSSGRP